MFYYLLMFYLCCISSCIQTQTIEVNLNTNWVLSSKSLNININNVTLPTSVHSILRSQNLIPDPLYRYNDANLTWIFDNDDWTFTNTFKIDNFLNLNKTSKINFIFDSVDTIASVYLNNKFILNTKNEFLKYQVEDLNSKLNESQNVLELKFSSATKYADAMAYLSPYMLPVVCPPKVQNGRCHVNKIRKQQCSFSWDWGPAFAPIGINGFVAYKIVSSFDYKFHLSVYPSIKRSLTDWTIDMDLILETNMISNKQATLVIKIDELSFTQTAMINTSNVEHNFKMNVNSNSINLWWPAGYGERKLYNLTAEVTVDGQSMTKSKMIGFRSIEMVEEPVSADPNHGLSFYFRINNVDIFLKGSNWIPADSFQELIDERRFRDLLESAVQANMNVLRIWGGGLYEKEKFYDVTNELGILIWHDFMFACSVYPTNEEYLMNVKKEVEYQVNRLRHHPSILIWAGNNENEAAVSTNWYGTDVDKELYANDYRTLYIDVIKSIVQKYDPEISRPYLSSSPTNGKASGTENWLAKNPYDWKYGDVHYYDYKMNGWDPSSFPLPRLMSEYGVQSLPSYSTLNEVYKFPDDAGMFSDLNNHRQHHGNGNQEIVDEIENNLQLPQLVDPVENFKSYIYLSQINQAMTLKTGTEVFRRLRDVLDADTGFGKCMGTMYWQFNDLWQAPTWSSIEYVSSEKYQTYGFKWKMAHYYIKNAYSKILLSPFLNNKTNMLEIYAISDDHKSAFESEFILKMFSYDSFDPKFNKTIQFKVEPLKSSLAFELSFDDIQKLDCMLNSNKSSCLIVLDLPLKDTLKTIQTNFLFLNNRLTDLSTVNKSPKLSIKNVSKIHQGAFQIDLETDAIALFVWLDISENKFFGIFSDNGFQMTSKMHTVYYSTDDYSVTLDEVKQYLTVNSLMNAYIGSKGPFINNSKKIGFDLSVLGLFLSLFYFIF